MSIEDAILELATAVRYLADSNRRDLANSAMLITKSEPAQEQVADAEREQNRRAAKAVHEGVDTKMREYETVGKARDEAKAQDQIKAVSQEIEAADTVKPAAELTPLDYKKDVQPILLDAIKKVGKKPMMDILQQYGVESASKLDPKDYAAVLAAAQKLAE